MNFSALMGIDWYWYLALYASPGLIYVISQLLKEYRNRPSGFVKGMLAAIGQAKKKSVTDHLVESLAYAIAAVSLTLGWPAFLVWSVSKARKDKARELEEDEPEFDCTPQYLVAKVDPVDAELTSYVIDPLNKVPPLPFGHLNTAWGNFLAEMLDPADELWSFYIPKGESCGPYGFPSSGEIRGFAKVRDGKVLGEFITESN